MMQFLLLLLPAMLAAEQLRFDGHQVIETEIHTAAQLAAVQSMGMDSWLPDGEAALGTNHIRIIPHLHAAKLRSLNLTYTVLVPNVQELVDQERPVNGSQDWFAAYHDWASLIQWYVEVNRQYPAITTWTNQIATSIQGRSIGVLTLGKGGKKVYIQCGIHAREWIAPATCNYVVNQLLTRYGIDSSVRNLLDNQITIHLVPSVNPDGYVYSWTNDRMWRKNRRANTGGSFGVDLNRNYDVQWGGGGSSGVPTSETYRGTAPFSEPESRGLGDYFRALLASGGLRGGIDMHSYSQLILRCCGWTQTPSADEAQCKFLGDGMASTIRSTSGLIYTSQKSIDLYVTTGTASDYFYVRGAPWSYTIELRPTGANPGFQLPPSQIVPTGNEIYAALITNYFPYVVAN